MATKTTKKRRTSDPRGTRYTTAQKKSAIKAMVEFRASNGRGAIAHVHRKTNIGTITLSGWLSQHDGASKKSRPAKAKTSKRNTNSNGSTRVAVTDVREILRNPDPAILEELAGVERKRVQLVSRLMGLDEEQR